MRDYWITRAIRICGSQRELAKRMRIKPEKVSYLLNRAKRISLEDALLLEEATNGAVTCFHLIEYLHPNIKKMLENLRNEIQKLRISERVAMAMDFEKELSNFETKNENNLIINIESNEEEAARKYGFSNIHSYRQAKLIVRYGSTDLISAMDQGGVSLSSAYKLLKISGIELNEALINRKR